MKAITPEECLVCRKHRGQAPLFGGAIYSDKLIFISHAQLWGEETEHYLGHFFIEPKRHVPLLSDLNREEAEAIGYYTSLIAKALIQTEGAEHVYSFVLGDHVPHVHVHILGRYPGAPREYWGPRVDEWPDAPRGIEPEINQVCDRIRAFLKTYHV